MRATIDTIKEVTKPNSCKVEYAATMRYNGKLYAIKFTNPCGHSFNADGSSRFDADFIEYLADYAKSATRTKEIINALRSAHYNF